MFYNNRNNVLMGDEGYMRESLEDLKLVHLDGSRICMKFFIMNKGKFMKSWEV